MAMVVSSPSCSHPTFLTGSPLFPQGKQLPCTTPRRSLPRRLSCRSSVQQQEPPKPNKDRNNESRLVQLALVAVAAGVLALGSPQDAMAGKSGGRVGGQAFRSAAPRSSGPRINNSRTNVYINPPVAPPLVGGYGYGYGGWGWSPFTFFAPGPSVAVGVGGGFEFFATILALSAIATVVRRFLGRNEDDDEDDY